jgi:hypothetical protein
MDKVTYDKGVSLQRQIDAVNSKKRAILNNFDNGVNADIDDPEYTNLTSSLRSSLAAYFDKLVAPLTDQFNAL